MIKLNMLVVAMGLAFSVTGVAQELKSLPGDETRPVPGEYLDTMVNLCESCHGPGGVSDREDVPSLADRPHEEILAELEKFYFYERHCPDVPIGDVEEGEIAARMSMCDVTNQMTRSEAIALAKHFEGAHESASQ